MLRASPLALPSAYRHALDFYSNSQDVTGQKNCSLVPGGTAKRVQPNRCLAVFHASRGFAATAKQTMDDASRLA